MGRNLFVAKPDHYDRRTMILSEIERACCQPEQRRLTVKAELEIFSTP